MPVPCLPHHSKRRLPHPVHTVLPPDCLRQPQDGALIVLRRHRSEELWESYQATFFPSCFARGLATVTGTSWGTKVLLAFLCVSRTSCLHRLFHGSVGRNIRDTCSLRSSTVELSAPGNAQREGNSAEIQLCRAVI